MLIRVVVKFRSTTTVRFAVEAKYIRKRVAGQVVAMVNHMIVVLIFAVVTKSLQSLIVLDVVMVKRTIIVHNLVVVDKFIGRTKVVQVVVTVSNTTT